MEAPWPHIGTNVLEREWPMAGDDAVANGAGKPSEAEEAADRGREGAAAGVDSELERVKSELAESRERLLRVAAEAENTRRRADQDVAQARKFALERFALELLPVRDSLERASAVDRQAASGAAEALFAGVDLTLQLMDSALEKFAITMVNPVGARFNPEQHQAMTMVESADVAPNHVVEVVQKGFLLNDRLLRPALVVVAKAPAEA